MRADEGLRRLLLRHPDVQRLDDVVLGIVLNGRARRTEIAGAGAAGAVEDPGSMYSFRKLSVRA